MKIVVRIVHTKRKEGSKETRKIKKAFMASKQIYKAVFLFNIHSTLEDITSLFID